MKFFSNVRRSIISQKWWQHSTVYSGFHVRLMGSSKFELVYVWTSTAKFSGAKQIRLQKCQNSCPFFKTKTVIQNILESEKCEVFFKKWYEISQFYGSFARFSGCKSSGLPCFIEKFAWMYRCIKQKFNVSLTWLTIMVRTQAIDKNWMFSV